MRKTIGKLREKGEGLIIRSQKLMEIDLLYFMKGGFWLFFSNVILTLCSIAVLIFFTNFMEPEVFGEWRFYLSVIGFASIFSLPGIFVAIQQSVASGYDSSLIEGIKIKLKWSLIGTLSLALASAYFYIYEPGTSWIYYLLTALLFPLFNAASCILYYLAGRKEFRELAKYKIVINLYINVALVASLLLTKSLFIVVLVYLLTTIVTHAYYYIKVVRQRKLRSLAKKDSGLGRYAFNLTLMDALQIAGQYADKIIIAKYMGFASLAIYALVISMVENLQTQAKIISILALPKFATLDPKESYAKVKQKLVYIILASLVAAIALYAILPWLVPFVFSEKYVGAVKYAQLATVTVITLPLISIFTSYLEALKKVKQLYYYRIGMGLIQLALFVILIPHWKIVGAVAAIIISQVLSIVLLIVLIESYPKTSKGSKNK